MKEPSSQAETLELICILDDSFYQHHLILNGFNQVAYWHAREP